MQLYHVDEMEFQNWLTSPLTSARDLDEAISVMKAKQALLWEDGADDSYYRDRYERDARYTKRIAACEAEKTKLWESYYRAKNSFNEYRANLPA